MMVGFKRHLTQKEKLKIQEIVGDAGMVDVLRLIGGLIANDHPDQDAGEEMKNKLFQMALRLKSAKGEKGEEQEEASEGRVVQGNLREWVEQNG